MKRLLIIIFFNLIILSTFSQINTSDNWPQLGPDAIVYNSRSTVKNPSYGYNQFLVGEKNITNVKVSRNPAEVLITNDNQFAFVRCYLSNTIEIIDIATGEVVKSLFVPCPRDFLLSKNGNYLYVASLTDRPFPTNQAPDDCSSFIIPLSGKSILTTINIPSQKIIKIDTIETLSIRRIFESSVENMLYMQGKEVIEYDITKSSIIRRWPFSQQIFYSEIDNKNSRIFLITIDTAHISFLKVIDLYNGDVLTAHLYTNGEFAVPFYIEIDTLSNRIFVQGKLQPYSEVLVFDAVSLNQLTPIVDANLGKNSFLSCPALGSIFIGAGFPNNLVELDYLTLQPKQILPFPLYSSSHTLTLSVDTSKLYTFQYGSSEDALSYINPPQYLDVLEYDIKTGQIRQYPTTKNKYECSYVRTLATTNDGQYLIATNSPENTISIIEIPYNNIGESLTTNWIKIYPNPTHNILNVSFEKQINEDCTIEIYNCIGSLLLKHPGLRSLNNYTFDLTKYPKGQYYIHIKSIDESRFFKVIKI